jgi:Protein of unknown function (DUF3043)
VFKRSSKSATDQLEPADSTAPGRAEAAASPSKGKATPKRRDAQALRRTSVIASGSRGVRGARSARAGRETREQAAVRRQAMLRGDENALPARDRGPARRFVRDYVDARRTVVSLFLPIGFPIIVLSLLPGIQLFAELALWLFFLAVAVDSVLMARRIRRVVASRFPGESTRGLGLYAVTRAMQIRRLRMPKPRVERGAKV